MKPEEVAFSERGREAGDDETADLIFTEQGCCFRFPCFGSWGRSVSEVGSGSASWERMRTAEMEDGWWRKGSDAFMKVREWSEMVAGPRWKTFIRRFSKNGRGGGGGGGRQVKFQYDPLSYALNFDDGHGQIDNLTEPEFGYPDFSARFAAPLVSAKSSSMDSGNSAAGR